MNSYTVSRPAFTARFNKFVSCLEKKDGDYWPVRFSTSEIDGDLSMTAMSGASFEAVTFSMDSPGVHYPRALADVYVNVSDVKDVCKALLAQKTPDVTIAATETELQFHTQAYLPITIPRLPLAKGCDADGDDQIFSVCKASHLRIVNSVYASSLPRTLELIAPGGGDKEDKAGQASPDKGLYFILGGEAGRMVVSTDCTKMASALFETNEDQRAVPYDASIEDVILKLAPDQYNRLRRIFKTFERITETNLHMSFCEDWIYMALRREEGTNFNNPLASAVFRRPGVSGRMKGLEDNALNLGCMEADIRLSVGREELIRTIDSFQAPASKEYPSMLNAMVCGAGMYVGSTADNKVCVPGARRTEVKDFYFEFNAASLRPVLAGLDDDFLTLDFLEKKRTMRIVPDSDNELLYFVPLSGFIFTFTS